MSMCSKCKSKENVPQFTASCGCSFCAKCIADDLLDETLCQEHGSISKEHDLDATGDGHHCRKKSRRDDYLEDCACASNEFPCKFYHLGCSFMGSPLALITHQNDVRVHTDLIVVKNQYNSKQLELSNLQEMTEKRCSELEKKFEVSKQMDDVKFEAQKQQLANAKEELNHLQEMTEKRYSELEKKLEVSKQMNDEKFEAQKQQLVNAKEELNHLQEMTEKRYSELEKKFEVSKQMDEALKQQLTDAKDEIVNLKETMGDLKPKMGAEVEFPIVKHCYTHIWKIEKFSKLQNEKKDALVRSDAFFTGPFGYKLSVDIYPNGTGQGKGTHLSCFLRIMKGPWDDILQWPLNYEAKFTLLAQSDKSHYSKSIESSEIQNTLFERPLTDFGKSWGVIKFFLLQDLKPFYLVHDNIFLKLDVNTNLD